MVRVEPEQNLITENEIKLVRLEFQTQIDKLNTLIVKNDQVRFRIYFMKIIS